jgi:hypothetical protein
MTTQLQAYGHHVTITATQWEANINGQIQHYPTEDAAMLAASLSSFQTSRADSSLI